jgi:hypothetical protein
MGVVHWRTSTRRIPDGWPSSTPGDPMGAVHRSTSTAGSQGWNQQAIQRRQEVVPARRAGTTATRRLPPREPLGQQSLEDNRAGGALSKRSPKINYARFIQLSSQLAQPILASNWRMLGSSLEGPLCRAFCSSSLALSLSPLARSAAAR